MQRRNFTATTGTRNVVEMQSSNWHGGCEYRGLPPILVVATAIVLTVLVQFYVKNADKPLRVEA